MASCVLHATRETKNEYKVGTYCTVHGARFVRYDLAVACWCVRGCARCDASAEQGKSPTGAPQSRNGIIEDRPKKLKQGFGITISNIGGYREVEL